MRKYWIGLTLVLLTVVIAPAAAQDTSSDSPLLQMLHLVADTPNNRQWISYGDMATWYKSWNVPPINSVNDLKILPDAQRTRWLTIAGEQTVVPTAFGLNYVFVDDMRGFYGFDVFNVDRFMQAGQPPDWITVVDFSFDKTQLASALTTSGYSAKLEADGATLYSILDDYAIDLTMETVKTKTGQLGDLNRIGLMDGQMVIGKATAPVENAFSAKDGESPSLADDPAYIAATNALDDPAVADTGDLVGAILIDHSQLDQAPTQPNLPASLIQQELATNIANPVPDYNLVTFATRHGNGATHLVLDVVFPEGTDAKAAANALANRMKSYVSLVSREPLSDRWTFEMATGTKIGGLPTALVVMKVDDPPPTEAGQTPTPGRVISWLQMVSARDTGYLVTQP